jgi:serine/threonine-protein kinase RsbW
VPSDIVVSVPARPEFLHVLRSVVASVAARVNFPYDAIEDLRIAVDEATANLLARAGEAGEVRLRVSPSSGGMEMVVSVDTTPDGWPPSEIERSLAWQVIEALTDEAALVLDGEWAAVRLTKALPGRPG